MSGGFFGVLCFLASVSAASRRYVKWHFNLIMMRIPASLVGICPQATPLGTQMSHMYAHLVILRNTISYDLVCAIFCAHLLERLRLCYIDLIKDLCLHTTVFGIPFILVFILSYISLTS